MISEKRQVLNNESAIKLVVRGPSLAKIAYSLSSIWDRAGKSSGQYLSGSNATFQRLKPKLAATFTSHFHRHIPNRMPHHPGIEFEFDIVDILDDGTVSLQDMALADALHEVARLKAELFYAQQV